MSRNLYYDSNANVDERRMFLLPLILIVEQKSFGVHRSADKALYDCYTEALIAFCTSLCYDI